MGGMGFRDMHTIILAMLGKQGWRLMHHPDTLASKILKAKYFPVCSFMDARLGNSPSLIWRSICEARKVLDKGLYWRVGDGRSIRVWQEKWLPSKPEGLPSTDAGDVDMNMTAATFIDETYMVWRRDLIEGTFNDDDAREILSIPLSRLHVPDKLIWRSEMSGIYFVRSVYRLLKFGFL